MNLTTLSKHPHVNSNHHNDYIYEIYYLIKSRSITFATLSKLTMSNLVDPMTRDNLDTNIITHDRNLIMISFMLCDVS